MQVDAFEGRLLWRERCELGFACQGTRDLVGLAIAEVDEQAIPVASRREVQAFEFALHLGNRFASDHVPHADSAPQRIEVAFDDHRALSQHSDTVAQAIEFGELVA